MQLEVSEKRHNELISQRVKFYGREEDTYWNICSDIENEIMEYYKNSNREIVLRGWRIPLDEHCVEMTFILERKHRIGYSIPFDQRNYYPCVLIAIGGELLPPLAILPYELHRIFSMDIEKADIQSNLRLLDKYLLEQEDVCCKELKKEIEQLKEEINNLKNESFFLKLKNFLVKYRYFK